ncbi:MAG: hypothetical protein QOH36_2433 [Actinomycetota bacterium]|jgi:hypothetical protein|nr:hypothetical protein [Actinomycetota bacterium]MEA2972676.1 hypothetical protein [Actinomycetota bacterium]
MRIVRRLCVVLAALGLLGGCGSGDDDDLATTNPTTAVVATTAPTTIGIATSGQCADQNFTPNSDDIAGDIVATGVSCAEAEAFVRRVGPLVGATGGPANIEVGGFACVRTKEDDGQYGIPSSDYECTNGDRKVTFHRT